MSCREVCIYEKITSKLIHKVDLFICIDKHTRSDKENLQHTNQQTRNNSKSS